MLDDPNVVAQRDPHGALAVAAGLWQQVGFVADIEEREHDGRAIKHIIVAGMGGSSLAALLIKDWLGGSLTIPFEVVRGYDLPAYVSRETLVIACSYSGNTEETLSCLQQARSRGAQVAVITTGGTLLTQATNHTIAHIVLPAGVPQRMAVLYMVRALVKLFVHFGAVSASRLDEVAGVSEWLKAETATWLPSTTVDKNEAKQLALLIVGKTPVIYGGSLTGALAYKWKISWNENAKNVAFCGRYPECNHNDLIGWTSHPVEKPFAVIDLVSSFEHPQIKRRMQLTDKLLSGKRPKAQAIVLRGDTPLAHLLWGCILADFVSTYVAILNGVDPVPVLLNEKLKKELSLS